MTAVGGTSLAYDAKGNITTNANAQTYVWDFDNRMASVNSGQYGYTYDALGRRVSKTIVIGSGSEGAKAPGLSSKKATASPTKKLGAKVASSTQITTVYVNSRSPLPSGEGQGEGSVGQELAEYQNSGSGTSFVLQRKFVYGDCFTERTTNVIRLISVRRATRKERMDYEENI